MNRLQCEYEWQRGRDSAYYENLGRQALYRAIRDDSEIEATNARVAYQNALFMRQYERKMRQAGFPKPQRKHPPQSKANKRGELTARQLAVWQSIADSYRSTSFSWLGYGGGDQWYIREDARVSDAVLQALERVGKIEITGVCRNGTLFRIVNPNDLPPPQKPTFAETPF